MQDSRLTKRTSHLDLSFFQDLTNGFWQTFLIGFKNWTEKVVLTVFENHRKSLFRHCERSELRLHFEWTKII